MTHDEATKDGATERYVLDDMPDEERDAFEEHYFECAVCAEDVRAAIALREGLAAVYPVDPIPAVIPFEPRRRRLPASLAAAAAAMIAVVSMYATVVQPQRRQLAEARTPHIADEYELRTVRGEESSPIDHRRANHLNVDLETDDKSPQYTLLILDANGNQRFAIGGVDGPHARSARIPLDLPSGALQPGQYILRVDGTEAGVATYRFTVR